MNLNFRFARTMPPNVRVRRESCSGKSTLHGFRCRSGSNVNIHQIGYASAIYLRYTVLMDDGKLDMSALKNENLR